MPSPFPGMDPYLEHRELWPGFHADLAVEIKRRLNRNLSERYYADVEILTVSDDADLEILHKTRPDVSVFETVSADEPTLDIGAGPVLAPAPVMRLAPLPTRLRSVRVSTSAWFEYTGPGRNALSRTAYEPVPSASRWLRCAAAV